LVDLILHLLTFCAIFIFQTRPKFIETYNAKGHFVRCHSSYVVNRKMIKSLSRVDDQITLLMPMKNGNDINIDIGRKYKKGALNALKGLY